MSTSKTTADANSITAPHAPATRNGPGNGCGPSRPRAARSHGGVALGLAALSLVLAPPLLLVPWLGFAPSLVAAAGVVVASLGLRRGMPRVAITVAGLVVSLVSFVLLAGVATVWSIAVVGPAVRDYGELHVVIEHLTRLVFGR